MNNKPSIEEAAQDLANIQQDIKAMRDIETNAAFLAGRPDVDSGWYAAARLKSGHDADRGTSVEKLILERYPALK